MKKLSILSLAALFMLGLVSCKKDYDCVCTYADGTKDITTFKDAKKKDAKDACETLSGLNVAFGDGTCDLD